MNYVHESNRISLSSPQGELLAEITFPLTHDHVVNINHTYVHPDLRGQQIADTLMRLALGDIQKSGLTFTATCPYAVRWLERHPEHKP
ncbi:MAG: GNAT family N-acetyltransferase [Butyricicoccus pullicaecorum]